MSNNFILFFEYFKLYYNIIFMKIKHFRKLNNLSCREVAEQIGVSLQAMQRYENEKAEPSIANLIKLANLFGVSVDTLIGNDAQIVDLSVLDEDRKLIINKVFKELTDVEVGQIIGVMKTFK